MPTALSVALRSFDGAAMEIPSHAESLSAYLMSIHRFSARLHFARNETIFGENDPADKVYKVISGVVRICRHAADGRRHISDFLLPGDFLGFLECADQPACAEAVTAVTVVAYPRACVDRLSGSDPSVRARILCHLSASLLEAQRQLFVLGCQSAKERVASFFVRLADRLDVSQGEPMDLLIGRQDIADHLGLTIETVSRAISALRADRLLLMRTTNQIIITNLQALRTLAVED